MTYSTMLQLHKYIIYTNVDIHFNIFWSKRSRYGLTFWYSGLKTINVTYLNYIITFCLNVSFIFNLGRFLELNPLNSQLYFTILLICKQKISQNCTCICTKVDPYSKGSYISLNIIQFNIKSQLAKTIKIISYTL